MELLIAVAGPAVTLAIAGLLWGWLRLAGEPAELLPSDAFEGGFAADLLRVNVMLFLFNLLPAFPLDGGRILRGVLGLATDWATATRGATRTGQALAVLMGGFALLAGQLMLAVVALLVYFSAAATHADERARAVLATQRVGDACNRHAFALTDADRLSSVVRYMLTSCQPDFAVMRGPDLVLRVLREAGLVDVERDAFDARWIYYSINRQALAELNQALGTFFDPERIKPRRLTCGPQGEFIRLDNIS